IGLEVVVRNGSPARVLNWMERARAAALLAVEPPAFAPISADIAALRAVQAETREGVSEGPAAARAERPGHEQAVLEERIRHATWRARPAAETSGAPVAAGALRDRLAGRMLVAYGVLRGELIAVVIGSRRSRIVPL